MAMTDLTAQRTLVKSPPELWSELSELESLAQHLEGFGEIRISRLEPERTVAWEGEHACGTVEIEAAGWGTKVTLTAQVQETEAAGDERSSRPAASPQPAGEDPPAPALAGQALPAASPVAGTAARRRSRLFGRWLWRRRRPEPAPATARSEAITEPVMAAAIADGALEIVEPGTRQRRPAGAGAAATAATAATAARSVGPADGRVAVDADRARAVLESTLEKLGQAHHRPFSRG